MKSKNNKISSWKFVRYFPMFFISILPLTIFISCNNTPQIEVATYQETVDAMKSIDFSIEVNNEKIDLTFSRYSTYDANGNLTSGDRNKAYFNFILKYNFLNDDGQAIPAQNLPLFITDAYRNVPSDINRKYTYGTRFIGRGKLSESSEISSEFSPFDIERKKNYSFLFSNLNSKNQFTTTMSIPKWYLRELANWKKYKDKNEKGVSEFFLKIKPINPYNSEHNNDLTDDPDWDLGNWKPKYEQLKIPFWLVEVIYNTEKDTFSAEIKDPYESAEGYWDKQKQEDSQ